jgi:hypothetical protein
MKLIDLEAEEVICCYHVAGWLATEERKGLLDAMAGYH